MRNRWEAGAETDLDEPATITERQLRSLRGGARAGRLAVLLALVAVLAAGWGLFMGSNALAGIQGIQTMRQKVLAVIGHSGPEEGSEPAASAAPATSVPVRPDSSLGNTQPSPPAPAGARTSQGPPSSGR